MAALENNVNKISNKELFIEYPWFYDNVFSRLKSAVFEFLNKEYTLKFISISYDDENILFFGDEYFVNKMPVNQAGAVIVRVSSGLVSSILDNSLGLSSAPFSLSGLTRVETEVLRAFTLFIYNKLEELLIKTEPNKKILKKAGTYNFTFYAGYNNKHAGKIIISMPDYLINGNIEAYYRDDCFDISSLDNTEVLVTIITGRARVPLNDLKALEKGDVIILDDSRTDKMKLLLDNQTIEFNITPNPALIISVEKNGDETMDDNAQINKESMWDTIMVDVAAEFDSFKMTLGELKQISEGLIVDAGSVYDGRIKLKAAGQVIAEGGLVILNDRFGVRIDTVKNTNDENEDGTSELSEDADETDESLENITDEENIETSEEEPAPKAPASKRTAAKSKQQKNQTSEDKNFDYSDFEIEDESI